MILSLNEKINFLLVKSRIEKNSCFKIRREVFIDEQQVPEELEIDELDNTAEHFLLYFENEPVATARMIKKDEITGKIGRVAVLKEYRSIGLGKVFMEKILEYSRNSGIKKLTMDAQTYVIPFYEKLNFKQYGEEFMDANIPHYRMELEL